MYQYLLSSLSNLWLKSPNSTCALSVYRFFSLPTVTFFENCDNRNVESRDILCLVLTSHFLVVTYITRTDS